ncbi:hypothetical protein J6590_070964 [Homalodisca vitripennis]|nr:hypothetical protein J6590_070964 [Homalodisca vitripennis]
MSVAITGQDNVDLSAWITEQVPVRPTSDADCPRCPFALHRLPATICLLLFSICYRMILSLVCLLPTIDFRFVSLTVMAPLFCQQE